MFVSYKMEQNILSMITKNRLKQTTAAAVGGSEGTEREGIDDFGCYPCEKSCTLCKNFLYIYTVF